MVRSKSEIWNHFIIDGKKSICKFCRKESFKNPSRMPVHLLKCGKCPTSVKERLSHTISKSCMSLCKKVPCMEDRLSQSCNSDSGHDFTRIADIEMVNEEVVDDYSEVYVPMDNNKIKEPNWSENNYSPVTYVRRPDDDRIVDEFSLFGDCVANKLRSIDNPQARSIAQYYINTILFRAEMTNFKDDKVVVPSPQEFNLFDNLKKEPPCNDTQASESEKEIS